MTLWNILATPKKMALRLTLLLGIHSSWLLTLRPKYQYGILQLSFVLVWSFSHTPTGLGSKLNHWFRDFPISIRQIGRLVTLSVDSFKSFPSFNEKKINKSSQDSRGWTGPLETSSIPLFKRRSKESTLSSCVLSLQGYRLATSLGNFFHCYPQEKEDFLYV